MNLIYAMAFFGGPHRECRLTNIVYLAVIIGGEVRKMRGVTVR